MCGVRAGVPSALLYNVTKRVTALACIQLLFLLSLAVCVRAASVINLTFRLVPLFDLSVFHLDLLAVEVTRSGGSRFSSTSIIIIFRHSLELFSC